VAGGAGPGAQPRHDRGWTSIVAMLAQIVRSPAGGGCAIPGPMRNVSPP
jgi:hypothetical protein